MFYSFGAATQGPSPANNPFATKTSTTVANPFATAAAGSGSASATQNKRNGPFSGSSDNEQSKRKSRNSFAGSDANMSDGGTDRKKRGKKPPTAQTQTQTQTLVQGHDRKKGFPNGDGKSQKPQANAMRKGVFGNDKSANTSRPTSPSSLSSYVDDEESSSQSTPTTAFPTTTDPHAIKVYNQLRKDGIAPPSWPSQPGAHASAAAMSKFRDQYEKYRSRVRKSLTKAGLIDDPNKRRALKDAIDFRGIAEDMCPEFEKITRITELDVYQPEKDPRTGQAVTSKMVKKLARSAAGQEAPLPMDVRSIPTLRKTLDYLIDDLLQHDGNLPTLHGFLWDRTRAIRRDFAFFSTMTPEDLKVQVHVFENIARFHVTALHLLSRKDIKPEDFVEQQELEQLGKTLMSLRDLYEDCASQEIVCENEAEFRAYYLIHYGQGEKDIMERIQRSWNPRLWRNSDAIRTAVSLVEALQNTKDFRDPLKYGPHLAASGAQHSYFRIVEDPSVSYTMACFAEIHFPHIRRSILKSITKAFARPKGEAKELTAGALNRFLRFDTDAEAVEFAQSHGLDFEPSEENPSDPSQQRLVLQPNSRHQLSQPKPSHQFSQSLVEKKRGSRRLPEVIHNTVFEDGTSKPAEGSGESSLFVPDSQPTSTMGTGFTQAPKLASSPFSGLQQSSGFTDTSFNSSSAPQGAQPKPNPFGSLSSQTGAAASNNPFASALKPDGQNTATAQPSQANPGPATNGLGFPSTAKEQVQSASAQPQGSKPSPFGTMFQPKPGANASAGAGKEATPASTITTTTTTSGTTITKGNDSAKTSFFPSLTSGSSPVASATSGLGQFKPTTPALGEASQASTGSSNLTPAPTGVPSPFAASKEATPSLSASATGQTLSPSPFAPATSANTSIATKPTTTASGIVSGISASPFSVPKDSLIGQNAVSAPKAPPRDLMGDFSKWFVKGDNGLLDDFEVYMVDNILRKVHSQWVEEEEERKRKEEEERINAEVETHRVYNLRVKFFYRWKNNARTKRMRALRQMGREQARAYHAAKREEEREAARKAAEKQAKLAKVDRAKEFTEHLTKKRARRNQAEEDLLATGVLSGVEGQVEHAARIVRRDLGSSAYPRTSTPDTSRPSTSGSITKRSGGKTQAIREKLFMKKTEGFRQSLSSAATRSTASPEPSRRASRVSEKWRLKAMGIVQMPDGTALPENLANEILYSGKQYTGLGSRPRASSYSTSDRRLPSTEMGPPERRSSLLSSRYGIGEPTPATNKRKRPSNEDGADTDDNSAKDKPHKRVMSESEKLIGELRAMREELEEGAAWYKTQRDRLQSEAGSRGTTPWDDSI